MNLITRCFALFVTLFGAFPPLLGVLTARSAEIPMYVGTYTKEGGAQGIYLCNYNAETGAVGEPRLAAATKSPSFLVVHPNKKFIYAVNEADGGSVSAFAIEPNGGLRELNRQQSLGSGPTHIAIDRDGKNVVVANYGGGSVAVLPIADDGTLRAVTGFMQHKGKGADSKRQEGPHAHSVYFDAANAHIFACDLGLDKIFVYRFAAANGGLTPADPPFVTTTAGSGPRHLALSAKGEFIYCVSEMANTVTVFACEANKALLHDMQTISTLPDGFTGNSSTAEIALSPNGRFLYVSNRGHDSIAGFSVDQATGKLTSLGQTPAQGKHPRYFGIDPSGKFLLVANRDSNNIVTFAIDEAGKLSSVSKATALSPVCLLFMP